MFNALAGRDHQLEGLIVNGEHTFHAAAEGSQAFAEAFRVLPAFERNSRTALKELDRFAADASPFLDSSARSSASSRRCSTAAKPFAPAVRHVPHLARAADAGREEGPAGHRQDRST